MKVFLVELTNKEVDCYSTIATLSSEKEHPHLCDVYLWTTFIMKPYLCIFFGVQSSPPAVRRCHLSAIPIGLSQEVHF